ncbi:MAG: chromosomal replication initiator protein DnaA [Patescibacteria group bacterium]
MLASFWEQFLQYISAEKESNPIFYSLLKQLKPVEIGEKKVVLSCSNQGVALFLQKKLALLEKHLSLFLNKKTTIEVVLEEKKKQVKAPLLNFEPSIEDVFKKAGLNDSYTFDSFAVSSSNQVAYAAANAVSDHLGKAYNPLLLYGGVGVGKTHIAQAVARHSLEKNQNKKVFFCPGDLFTNELIESIREKTTMKFRKKYRNLDLLIVDDVQFIAGKVTVQEEFFHTFNNIISAGKQVILTSDRHPREIKNLEERLRSRFSGGLTVDIGQPDFELRTAILLIKAKEKNIQIDLESAKLIAEQVQESRSLEGVLLSIYAKTLTGGGVVNLEAVEAFFSSRSLTDKKNISPNDVIKTVCMYYDIKQTHIKSSQRSERFSLPRQIVMFFLRNSLGLTFEEIARLLKKKDHTTIIHGVEKIKKMITKDVVFKQEVDRLSQSIHIST